ncbi:MAG: NAD(P)/FAD-dependent oxidoreductase [Methanolinea sp.]|nr:NAD(P)/FAD-dependent oxidoreductase [Methanolinea sp.]
MEGEVNRYEVIVVGGGPSGLFCAIFCAAAGKKVAVLEKMPSCGRKLLISGSGQCNITHGGDISSFLSHYGEHGKFVKPALMQFSNQDIIAFFLDRGLGMITEPGGKVFPVTRRSSDVLEILLAECDRHGVDIHCSEPVLGVETRTGGFFVMCGKEDYHADSLVIATGGATYPVTGSSGDGYSMAGSLGHPVTGIAPALAAVLVKDYPFADLAGMSFENIFITLSRQGKKVSQHRGDLLFTHTGLSGPGVLDISRYILQGDILKVSFIPFQEPESARKTANELLLQGKGVLVSTVLKGLSLPERLVKRLLGQAGVVSGATCAHLPKSARNSLVVMICGYPFQVRALGGFDQAMVTGGGVDLGEVNPRTMESRLHRGLYFIGEILDIDGDSGGYNLQFACSSGVLAAKSITGEE